MTTDPGTGLDGGAPEVPGLLSPRDVLLGIVVGLVLAAALVVVTPGARTHLLGGTDLRETTVVAVRPGAVPGDVDKPRTTYDLTWSAGADDRTATFRRSGDPDHAVGDTWDLWVSPDGSVVETTSPLTTWLWLGIGLPLFILLIGLVVRWRGRTEARAVVREAERIEARRGHAPGPPAS
ncbi:hypothetical protein SAMN04489844_2411 [Nocardioides exalbidus]|uniref:DUF3592 domain-containing protein n=1 Tax=Nocardioides exalbidus TaxID=402596 RepID=A0A1H4T1S5_9ACTN|nr:hypothetical protein [Nocardioides exalbidus]SEC50061.1 hypothetical protein SAMN04489844_2411 [Nocardioides exalbidus]